MSAEIIARLEALKRQEDFVVHSDLMKDAPNIRDRASKNSQALEKAIGAIRLLDARGCFA